METPFKNDPFAIVWAAYKKLYDKPCEVWWDYKQDASEEEQYGFTSFPLDGTTPAVYVFLEHPVHVQVETLAHELAHVAVGIEHEHDEVWDAAFSAIQTEYTKIIQENVEKMEDDHDR